MTDDTNPDPPTPESLAAAFDSARETLSSSPEDLEALTSLVTAGTDLGGNGSMLGKLETLKQRLPDRIDIAFREAQVHFTLGFPAMTLESVERILDRSSNEVGVQARQLKVKALLKMNRLDEAERATGDLIRRGFGAKAVALLAQIDLARGDHTRAIGRLRPMIMNPAINDSNRMAFGFDLAKALDKAGEHDEAFTAAAAAAAIGHHEFDVAAFETETEAIVNAFTSAALPELPRSTSTDQRPVFVLGMPRSGTTLLEQIIDAHPEAIGIGERREFEMAAHLLAHRTGRPFPEAIASATTDQLDDLAGLYLGMIDDLTPRLGRAATTDTPPLRAVNKALNLDRLIGLIARTLPGARIIVLRRNPLDNLVSIHLNPLSPVTNPWTGSLEGIIAARRRFDRLADHWKETIDLPILDLAYEDLASEPEARIRELLDFLDLPFDERCLSFHASGRVVMTPSANQVNRPMNTTAIARWRRYEKHLGPALEAFPDAID